MKHENIMKIEISTVYDGICLIYYPREKRFEWLPVALKRTTPAFRKEFEHNFLEDLNN